MWRRQPGGDSLGSGGRSADIENYVTLWRLGGVGRLRRAVARSDETFCLGMLGGIILMYIDAHFSHGRRLPDVSFKVSTSSRPLTQIRSLLKLTASVRMLMNFGECDIPDPSVIRPRS